MRNVGLRGVAVLVTAGMLAACGPSSGPEDDVPAGSSSLEASEEPVTMSPSVLPTLPAPTAPPSAPTDVVPHGILAGRVSAVDDSCVELTTDDGEVWSLSGEPRTALAVGDTVTAKVADLEAHEEPCGEGRPARLVSIEVVGQQSAGG